MNTGRRLLFAIWIAIVGWLLREFRQRKAIPRKMSAHDMTSRREMALSVDFWYTFLADDKIFGNKSRYFSVSSTTKICSC
jgi:hypothetical protein